MSVDFRANRPQVVNPREFEVGKRPRDEETEALIKQAFDEQEQQKIARKGPPVPVGQAPQRDTDKKTLAEIEDEEGGPVKESMVGMASTKRALSRKEQSAATGVDTDFGDVGEVQQVEEDLEIQQEEGITFEPFHLKEEREEGFFDEDGNYVQQKDEGRDAWLDSEEAAVVSEAVRLRLEQQQAAIAAAEKAKKNLTEGEIARMKMEMVEMMEAGETVIKALKRMGAQQASKKVLSKRERQKAEQQRSTNATADEVTEAENRKKFTRLTDLADTLLSNGELDIYTLRKEILESEARLYMPRTSLLDAGPSGAADDDDDDMFAVDDDDAPPKPAEPASTTNQDGTTDTAAQQPAPTEDPPTTAPAPPPHPSTSDDAVAHAAGQAAAGDQPGTSGREAPGAVAGGHEEPAVDYASWPVKELRRFLQERGVDSSDIVEKAELAQKVRELAEAGPQGEVGPIPAGYVFDPNSGYYYSDDTGLCYDPSSGGFYQSSTGKWYSWDDGSQQFVEWPGASDTNS